MRRWFDLWGAETVALLTKVALLALLASVPLVAAAKAAPLSVHGRQANLYGGRLGMARVCADLHLTKPAVARFSVQGARQFSTYTPDHDGSWAQHRTLHLRPGHRKFCRSFTLRYWRLSTAVKLVWRAEVFNAVHAELAVGGRTYSADRLVAGARSFAVVSP